MNIIYLVCPRCENEFYITDEFAGQGYDWFCPRCRHVFTEDESLRRTGASTAAEGKTKEASL